MLKTQKIEILERKGCFLAKYSLFSVFSDLTYKLGTRLATDKRLADLTNYFHPTVRTISLYLRFSGKHTCITVHENSKRAINLFS
jgi:hypothetical protein